MTRKRVLAVVCLLCFTFSFTSIGLFVERRADTDNSSRVAIIAIQFAHSDCVGFVRPSSAVLARLRLTGEEQLTGEPSRSELVKFDLLSCPTVAVSRLPRQPVYLSSLLDINKLRDCSLSFQRSPTITTMAQSHRC